MNRVVLVLNEGRPGAVELARSAADWLAQRDIEVRLPSRDAAAAGLDDLGTDHASLEAGTSLVLAFGGDGTVLRAVALAAPQGAAVLGVNLGRLGYLSVVEPGDLCPALERFRSGRHAIDERTMLSVTSSGDRSARHLALNEAVLEKTQPGNTVHLALSISGRRFTSYVTDALIVATPTGSTAYSFSAGGPIVSPRQHSMIVTPVAPHTPFTHSLVLDAGETVRIDVLDRRGAVLSLDGCEAGTLGQGATVEVGPAPVTARFVTFGERDFFAVLKAKFGLSDR